MIAEIAPAKVNLYLHVGPVRDDGLHELASLFVFTQTGDVVSVYPAQDLSLEITGAFAEPLAAFPISSNLVYRAAIELRDHCGIRAGARMVLEKNLPIAAGIGGGSADAAAALRALSALWSLDLTDHELADLAFRLGADIPACLWKTPVNVTGAGETIESGPILPPMWICLVNPGVEMATGPIFKAFDAANPSPRIPTLAGDFPDRFDPLMSDLAQTRNDLEPFAIENASEVKQLLMRLEQHPGAGLARMSGSGATCFALFESDLDARACAKVFSDEGYWSMASAVVIR